MNNTNHLVNGDNKGYAAYAAEKKMNRDSLPGKGPFVAGFAQANEGDVSPNTEGAFCGETDIPCDGSLDTKCPGSLRCFGRYKKYSYICFEKAYFLITYHQGPGLEDQ